MALAVASAINAFFYGVGVLANTIHGGLGSLAGSAAIILCGISHSGDCIGDKGV